MDIEIEQKYIRRKFFENETDLPDCNVIEGMNKLGFKKTSCKRKRNRNKDRLHKSLSNHKDIKNNKL